MSESQTMIATSLWEEFDSVEVAEIAVDVDAPDLKPTYSYAIPEALKQNLPVGSCVHVPFAGRETSGYVMERRLIPRTDGVVEKLRNIVDAIPDAAPLNEDQIHIARWISERCVCSLIEAIHCVIPVPLGARVSVQVSLATPSVSAINAITNTAQAQIVATLRSLGGCSTVQELRQKSGSSSFSTAYAALVRKGVLVEEGASGEANTRARTVRAYRLGPAAGVLMESKGSSTRRTPQQERVLAALVECARDGKQVVASHELVALSGCSPATIKTLVNKGLLEATEIAVRRAPITGSRGPTLPPPLTADQRHAIDRIRGAIHRRAFDTLLLFGVTASGKTEVYLNAIASCLEAGRSAIVLVPEIALTAQVVDVFFSRFGDKVAVLHSRLSEGERYDEWRRMMSGEAVIAVGARSAVFAPVRNLGLIVIDEEHEASYKQDSLPRYNAREVAEERARIAQAPLVLGSATPSVETFYLVSQAAAVDRSGQSGILEMPTRIDNRPMPRVSVVDLREEFKVRRSMFSERLLEAMALRLKLRQQTILFLNRRGYAQFILCRDCGFVAKCPNCAISLAFHAIDRTLRCHHCDYTGPVPEMCPDCSGVKIRTFGVGTEKVEEEVLRAFPEARVARMDRDTTARKGAHARIIQGFRTGDAQILIGTQMVAKGFDFPNVTLVGVVSADSSLNLPDFRASERSFQLLTQVAGRAGRGTTPGEVIIQTFAPDHFAVKAAVRQAYRLFYEKEIQFRSELNYPPFSRLANLICSDAVERTAELRAVRLAEALRGLAAPQVEIIGPAPAPIARLRNMFRFHVAIRAPRETALHALVRSALASLAAPDRRGIAIDIDPQNMA